MKNNIKDFIYDGAWAIFLTFFLVVIVQSVISFSEYQSERVDKYKQCDYALNHEKRSFQGEMKYNFNVEDLDNNTFACCLYEHRIVNGILSTENCKIKLRYSK